MSSADMFEIDENRPSAVFVVIDKIKALLIEQKLKPGDLIPSESVLAESLKVGRGTVREALKILSAYGVVEIKRGTGTSSAAPPRGASSIRHFSRFSSRTGTTRPSPRCARFSRRASSSS